MSDLLKGGNAHISFQVAVKDLPAGLRGKKAENISYTIWKLVEHIRIAQHDMLQFCLNPRHQSPKWPEGFWPVNDQPSSEAQWNDSIGQIADDRRSFINLVEDEQRDLFFHFPHGEGQNIFKEALQVADHTSYHTGEILVLRRLFGDWNS